jgi:hypothetical protein
VADANILPGIAKTAIGLHLVGNGNDWVSGQTSERRILKTWISIVNGPEVIALKIGLELIDWSDQCYSTVVWISKMTSLTRLADVVAREIEQRVLEGATEAR